MLHLSGIKVDKPDAVDAMVPAVGWSRSAALLPVRPLGAAPELSLFSAATRLLWLTPLHPSAFSAPFSPSESLVGAVAAAFSQRVPLAGSLAPSPTGISATQQAQGKKRG